MTDAVADTTAEQEKKGEPKDGEKVPKKKGLFDKSLGTAANLSKLLPTGTTLAFQTMAPSFTNRGNCHDDPVNSGFTWGLISLLTFLCALLSFTDSITDKDGNTLYGLATPRGIKLFNHKLSETLLPGDQDPAKQEEMRRKVRANKKWQWRDLVHAVLSAGVFLSLAFCDAGVQSCLVPLESRHWKEFLGNLPLAVGFLASFFFMIFPSNRNGVGNHGAEDGAHEPDGDTPKPLAPAATEPTAKSCKSSLQRTDITQVAPSTSYELDPIV